MSDNYITMFHNPTEKEARVMSDFLFANPSFIDGAMSVIDLFGVAQEYNSSNSDVSADARAMRADALAVKADFISAYESAVDADA